MPPSYVVGTNYRVLIYCTCHFQGSSFSFSFCLLVSSVSDFHPDTRGEVVALFLGSLVQLHCGEGGMLQTNNTGVCSQCLSHTGSDPGSRRVSPPCPRCSGSRLLRREPSVASLAIPGPSRSGSGTQVVLRGTDSRLGLGFVPFPNPSSSGDEVFGRLHCCDLLPPRLSVI